MKMGNLAFVIIATAITIPGLLSCSGDNDHFTIKNEDILPVTTLKNISYSKILDDFFIHSIEFDKDGNAWIGTFQQGVIKYDKKKDTEYFNSSNSLFTDDVVIYSIAIDNKDNIWIGSGNAGLIKYDRKTFTQYTTKNSPLPEDFVHSIHIDSQNHLWFSSSRHQTGGLVKFDSTDQWEIFTPENSKIQGNLISDIAISGNDVWVGFNDYVNNVCLAKLTNNKITVYTEKQLGFTPYNLGNLCIDSKHRLYVVNSFLLSSAINSDGPHLFAIDGEFTRMITCPYGNIFTMSIDSKDNVWCVPQSSGSILIYKQTEWVAIDIFPENDHTIFCIKEAPDGKIWLGTENGIYIVNPI